MVKRKYTNAMNAKLLILTAAATSMASLAACEHDDIYEPLEFSVRLSESNTYRAGEPVRFEFGGNADFITIWNGDTGHEYRYRDRTAVDAADIERCCFEIELKQMYGDAKAEVNNLDIYATASFPGLDGADAAADRAAIEALASGGMSGWRQLGFTPNRSGKFEIYDYDITEFAENFCIAFHFHHDADKNMRTYQINVDMEVELRGYDVQKYGYSDMSFIPFSLAEVHADNPYVCNERFSQSLANGVVKLRGYGGSATSSAADIVFQGFNAGQGYGQIDTWVFLRPMPLNAITPDTGMNIKGVTDDVDSYEYTYDRPGTYTATFIVSNGNYMGHSGKEVREVTFTVVDNLK